MPEYKRRLPHFHPDDAYLFLPWRLWGSLPVKAEAHRYPSRTRIRSRRPPTWLPNQVHLPILPRVPVSALMKWLKGSTARGANQILGRTGMRFWQDESYDHYLRDSRQLNRTMAYIEETRFRLDWSQTLGTGRGQAQGGRLKSAPPEQIPCKLSPKCRNSRWGLCPQTRGLCPRTPGI